jgi:thioredoxin 1
MRTFDEHNFQNEVLNAKLPVLVKFSATWCAPCKALSPLLAKTSNEQAGKLIVGELDVDKSPGVTARYSVGSLPTLILFRGGVPVNLISGNVGRAQLNDLISDCVE